MDGGGSSQCTHLLLKTILRAEEQITSAQKSSDSGLTFLIVLFVVFVVVGGYFAGAESSFTAMDKIKLKSKAEMGNKRAKVALFISNNFDRAITTLLIGNNITHIAAGSIATLITVRLLGDENGNISSGISVASTFIATGVVFLFSEMIPKSFANDRANSFSLAAAGSLKFLMKIFKPFSSLFMGISQLFTKLFSKESSPSMTEDELIELLDTAESEGVMDEEQTELIKSAFSFSDKDASDVMTMRDDIFAIDIKTPRKQMVEILTGNNHSRIPVYDGSLDNIVGILNIRSFFRQYKKNSKFSVKSILSPVFYAHTDSKIGDLLNDMSMHKSPIAIVTNDDSYSPENTDAARTKFPYIVGLVTIEDFLEELVGEIFDEDDVIDENFMKLGGNRFSINANLTLSDAFSRIGYVHRNKSEAKMSVSEWTVKNLGNETEIREDDSFLYENILITVDDVDENQHPTKVIFHVLDDDEYAELLAEKAAENADN